MLQYLIILLDDTSIAFCHAENPLTEKRLISLQKLKEGIFFAMKEKLNVQFVYPKYELPLEYNKLIESIDHTKIKPQTHKDGADVIVLSNVKDLPSLTFEKDVPYVLRCSKTDFFEYADNISEAISKVIRLNIIITDLETLNDSEQNIYSETLRKISSKIEKEFCAGKFPQTNILTDRIFLEQMNNCNAGDRSITLASNGKFYVCPGFYYDECTGKESDYFGTDISIGSPTDGVAIRNQQLYKLKYAPICRICDAYHCKRCVWLNKNTTREINTPCHEQCLSAHIERKHSRELLISLNKIGTISLIKEIPEVDYLDPFIRIKR